MKKEDNNGKVEQKKSSIGWIILGWVSFFHALHTFQKGECSPFFVLIYPFIVILLFKLIIFLFKFFSKTILRNIIGIVLIIISIFMIISFSSNKNNLLNTPNNSLEQTFDEKTTSILKDYGAYYGIFTWYPNYCHNIGYDFKNTDKLKNKYKDEIEKIIKLAQQHKIYDVSISDAYNNEEFISGFHKGIMAEFKNLKKLLTISKLTNGNINNAQKYLHMNDDDFFKKYEDKISDIDICKEYDERLMDDKNPINNIFIKYR